ncbi:protein MGARP [Hyla sarda]|uniref:protein MGARP n=1 Tax=Hyla sarda TaxID=327740 RepID=UPI0024C2B95A|nr:protein MGARP [Hyla sarda]
MHLCRNALQKLVPLTHRGAAAILRNGSVRQMSSSSVPGSSGDALPYYLLVGVSVAGGGFYAYRTLSRDKERYQDRHEYIHTQLRPAFEAPVLENAPRIYQFCVVLEPCHLYSPPLKGGTASTSSETIEEAVESAIEEVAAEAITDQEGAPSAPVEEEQTKAEGEAAPAPTQEAPEPSTQAASESEPEPSTETTAELEPEPSTEAASEQVEPESIESVSQTLEETSPVLETSSENITEELVEAAEDWPELTPRKPEETEVESVPADPEIEIEEAVESEQASASS